MHHVLQQLHPFMQLMFRRRARRQRFTNYVKRQKALSSLANTLLKSRDEEERNKPIVISFGAARFGTCGPQKSLVKELKKRRNVRIVSMDEHRTSVLCSRCAYLFPDDIDATQQYMQGKMMCHHSLTMFI